MKRLRLAIEATIIALVVQVNPVLGAALLIEWLKPPKANANRTELPR